MGVGGGGHFLSGSLLRLRRKQKENLVSTSVLAGAGGQADGLGRECPPELASPWGRVGFTASPRSAQRSFEKPPLP